LDGQWLPGQRIVQPRQSMKKKRRAKSKLALQWTEEKYSPPMVLRTLPHTGETKVLHAAHFKSASQRTEKRPAA